MIRVLPLGGLGEVGKNCMALVLGKRALIVDCGVTFQHPELGVERVHPNFEALHDYTVEGVVLTHGHEDHIGAVPYLLEQWDVPVFGPRYALELLQRRASEFEVLKSARMSMFSPGTSVRVGSFDVEPVSVAHSIPDACALSIMTEAGRVLHSGDFKIDESETAPGKAPIDALFDRARFEQLGREGVELLLSDSTNALLPGTTVSEAALEPGLEAIFAEAGRQKTALIVSLFASNVARLQTIGELALQHRRRIVLLGRSMQSHARLGLDLGLLKWPSGLAVGQERAKEIPREQCLFLATGSQAEPEGALRRLADGSNPYVRLLRGDTVVFSSRVIPGNERAISKLEDDLARLGARVITPSARARAAMPIHASGHAMQEEQKALIELTKPRNFIPIHGTYRMLEAHAALANQAGAMTLVIENGASAGLDARGLFLSDAFQSGNVYRGPGAEIENETLTERKSLAMHGSACAIIRKMPGGALQVELVLRGVAIAKREQDFLKAECARAIREAELKGDTLETAVRSLLRRRLPPGPRGHRIEPQVLVLQ
jgi:ribonuclease J